MLVAKNDVYPSAFPKAAAYGSLRTRLCEKSRTFLPDGHGGDFWEASSALAFFNPLIRNLGWAISHFIVPNGCSTVSRRSFIQIGSAPARRCIASRVSS